LVQGIETTGQVFQCNKYELFVKVKQKNRIAIGERVTK